MGEIIFLGLLAVVCVVCFAMSLSFPISVMDKSGGPAFFPQVVIVFILVFLVIRLIMVLREKEKLHFVFAELFCGIRLFFFVAIVLYVVLIQSLGYVLCTLVFLLTAINVFYYKTKGGLGNIKSVVIRNLSIFVFVFGMNAFFSQVLKVILPTGSLWF